MVHNFFYNSKTAKTDPVVHKYQFYICPLAAPEKMYGFTEVSSTVFIVFNIPIHY